MWVVDTDVIVVVREDSRRSEQFAYLQARVSCHQHGKPHPQSSTSLSLTCGGHQVVRDQKAERAIRAIILLNDMRMHFLSSDVFTANDEEDDGVDYVSKLTAEQVMTLACGGDEYDTKCRVELSS